jgi:hypothetical protein
MAALDSALENIEPESSDQHVELAVLIGRPIAVVRAALGLELLGSPAVHEGWNQFRQDMKRGYRDSDGFTRVRFPVRLGAHQQLDDGLIGYWLDDGVFHTPLAQAYAHPAIRTCADGPLDIPHAVDDPPRVVRMLVDPRGKVHVTSGIQPVKAISIPPSHYVAAMGALEMTFPCVPLLTDRDAVNLPLPTESGYRWAWVSEAHGRWNELSLAAAIERDVFVGAVAVRLWDQLSDPHIGWLQTVPGISGQIRAVAVDERTAAALDPPFQAMTGRIEAILAPVGNNLLDRPATLERFADTIAAPMWTRLLSAEVGWLRPIAHSTTRAELMPRDSRAQPVLTGDLAGTEPLIDAILDLGEERVGPASTVAGFATAQQLRGGWLKLRHDDTTTT